MHNRIALRVYPKCRTTHLAPHRRLPLRSWLTTHALLLVVLVGVATGCSIAQRDSEATTAGTQSGPATPAGSVPGEAASPPATTPASATSVWLGDLTSPEVASRVGAGATTVIIPTGGIEQNGPHMAIDKHQVVVVSTAQAIAERAGNTLVAPVMSYVPEGDPTIMDNHLQWAGTISVTEPVFAQVLESVATSLSNQGFTTIAFLGDSGSSQAIQTQVATDLSQRWADRNIKVVNLDAYYQAGADPAPAVAAGVTASDVGTHAAVLDTSQVLAIDPSLIRPDALAPSGSPGGLNDAGFDGDPTQASAAIGQAVLEAKVSAGVEQLANAR